MSAGTLYLEVTPNGLIIVLGCITILIITGGNLLGIKLRQNYWFLRITCTIRLVRLNVNIVVQSIGYPLNDGESSNQSVVGARDLWSWLRLP